MKKNKKIIGIIIIFLMIIILSVINIYLINYCNNAKTPLTMAEVCKVVAYLEGYDSKEISLIEEMERVKENELYWYTDYVNYVKELHIFSEFEPQDGFDSTYFNELKTYKHIEVSKDGYYFVSKQEFMDFVIDHLDVWQQSDSTELLYAGIVATPDMDTWSGDIDSWKVCTNKGEFYYTGLNLNGMVDKTVPLLVCKNEVVMIGDNISNEVTYKNIWISGVNDGVLEVNMYGINRQYKIKGTSKEVQDNIGDIQIKKGQITGITVRFDIADEQLRIVLKTTGYTDIVHSNVTLTSNIGYTIENKEDGSVINMSAKEEWSAAASETMPAGSRYIIKPENPTGQIQILTMNRSQGNPSYKGEIEVFVQENGIVLVNQVALEEYLKRVVPSEMPTSFGVEALKVQAVCARSYAYKHIEAPGYPDYSAHMDDSIQYQVYNNTIEYEPSNTAVEMTRGKMLYYADALVQTYYYSTSCGVGTDVSLWGSNRASYPYYESKQISQTQSGIDYTNEEQFKELIKNTNENDYDYGTKYYRWSYDFTEEEFNNIVKAQKDIGNIKEIICDRVAGGAVKNMRIVGDKSEVTIESEGYIRKVFNLPSAFFVIEKTDVDGKTGYTITGGGNGHGIGMSQYAVKKMTELGMDYKSVLLFFFPGTNVF